MPCQFCNAEAVSRCFNCGELVCAEHGKNDTCPACSTGIASGDPRTTHTSGTLFAKPEPQHAWWRPQEAEEYQPPACYECKGLSRGVCRNCQAKYCLEHAGVNGLCQYCGRSANLGLYIVVATLGIFGLSLLFTWLFG